MDWLKAIFGFLRDADAERILAFDGWSASVGSGTAVGVCGHSREKFVNVQRNVFPLMCRECLCLK